MTIRAPRNLQQATELLERFAVLDGQIAEIEANRTESIAAVNARCDTAANDLIGQRDAIAEKLKDWWPKNAAKLTDGKRKSIELGGCMIGSKAGRVSLAIDGDENAIAVKLSKRTWADGLFRTKVSLDKPALLKAVEGTFKKRLAALGLTRKDGDEAFFIERTQQSGTQGGAG